MTQSAPDGRAAVACEPIPISLSYVYENYDAVMETCADRVATRAPTSALAQHMHKYDAFDGMNGFARMQACRRALEALDRRGWDRSHHQKVFHDQYIRACARIFFKHDSTGAFSRAHQKILELNGWDSLPQEVLISTPRRFGKTISVSMFAAAMLFSCPKFELSIYSTCKRISQKLLRNIVKFLNLIYEELDIQKFKVLRENSEEVHIKGNESATDLRVVNSYPSKASLKALHPSQNNMRQPNHAIAPTPHTRSTCTLYTSAKAPSSSARLRANYITRRPRCRQTFDWAGKSRRFQLGPNHILLRPHRL